MHFVLNTQIRGSSRLFGASASEGGVRSTQTRVLIESRGEREGKGEKAEAFHGGIDSAGATRTTHSQLLSAAMPTPPRRSSSARR